MLNEVKDRLHLNKEILRCALLDFQETTRNEFSKEFTPKTDLCQDKTPADVACPTEVVAIALHEVVGGEEAPIIQLCSNRVAQVSVTTAANVRHCHLRAVGELRQRIAIHMRMFEPWRREHPCRDGFPRPSAVPRAEGKTFLGGLPVVTRPTDHRAGEVNRRVRTGEIDLFPGHALSVGLPQAGAMRLQGAVVIPHHYIVFALTGMPRRTGPCYS